MTIQAHITVQDKDGKVLLERTMWLSVPVPDLLFYRRKAYLRHSVSGGVGHQGKDTGRLVIYRESDGHMMLNDQPMQQPADSTMNRTV